MSFVVAAFYHFFDFPYFAEHKQLLKEEMVRLGIKGSVLIAAEGFNGTVAGSRESIDAFLYYLKAAYGPFDHKESTAPREPFARTKVRLKKETISLGEPIDPSLKGIYVDPKDWNALITDPDTIVLDTRNAYETHLGTFENAIDPKTRTFKELPDFVRHNMENYKDKKIATFCTGGIRCEKFTSWMLAQGFEHVYHLKGGILKYLEEVPEAESTWNGECYVFDERVAVGHGLKSSETATMCPACGHALTPSDRSSPLYVENIACGHCPTKRR